jgi:hypothetical protein
LHRACKQVYMGSLVQNKSLTLLNCKPINSYWGP